MSTSATGQPDRRHPRILVVGGGISGLAAAWAAHERSAGQARVALYEAADRVGGKARTVQRNGWCVETGPTGYLDTEPVLADLARRAGLEPIEADEAAARRYLIRGGRAREIRPQPLAFARSGILSPLGLLRLLAEPLLPRRSGPGDESVFDFARRRLGAEAARRMIAPMVLGVFAGDARRLSLSAAFPRMAELEAEHRSLFLAMKRLSRTRRVQGGPAGPAGRLTSFEHGLESLPHALAARAPFDIRTSASVTALEPVAAGHGWSVTVDGEVREADAVVLAADCKSSARLLSRACPDASQELAAIPTPGLAVVALGYGREGLERMPRGFGALAPREEGLRILGCLWDTHLFPGRSPEGKLLVRCMIGGATDPDGANLLPVDLVEIAHADLVRLFGPLHPPEFSEVTRWPEAIPQYELGHAARLERIETALTECRSGLHLAGNALHGVAFGKAAAHGWSVGEAAAEGLARGEPTRS